MEIFEYLSIAYSLVFSFAAIRLVAGLPHAIAAKRRYSVHISHVVLMLFALVALFWSFWSFRDLEWNFFSFISLLAGPGLVYFLACTLIPDEPAAVTSWGDYFYSVRRQYFIGVGCWSLLQLLNTTVWVKIPLLHPSRVVQAFLLAMGVAGASTASPAIHRILAIASWLIAALTAFVIFSPGSLTDQLPKGQ